VTGAKARQGLGAGESTLDPFVSIPDPAGQERESPGHSALQVPLNPRASNARQAALNDRRDALSIQSPLIPRSSPADSTPAKTGST